MLKLVVAVMVLVPAGARADAPAMFGSMAPRESQSLEPASLAALTVGVGGLIRVRLRKADRLGSRRRR
ncbi:MAG: hypothetical protein WCK51_12540 [Armatimonadota bacterium]